MSATPTMQTPDPAIGFPETRRLAEFLASVGQPCVRAEDGSTIWIPGVRAELQRMPFETASAPTPREVGQVLSCKGIWIASYMVAPATAGAAPNCFDYVCRDGQYDIEKLDKPARRDIRRGARSFTVRRSTWDEVTQKGFEAFKDTELRHGHLPPSPGDLEDIIGWSRHCPLAEAWGAWDEAGLAAWVRVLKADRWALITHAYSRMDALRNCPNNPLVYDLTRTLLLEEKRAQVSYGVSSLQATDNILSLHKFKIRMGYVAEPMCRQFVLHPMLRPFLQGRPQARLLRRLSALRPHSGTLKKVSGLASLLAGLDEDPLAWARGGTAEESEQA